MEVEQVAQEAVDRLSAASQREGVPEALRNQLATAVEEGGREANRRVLRLAVIGEYSTGKSSFLNALLRTDLLSVDDRPTTAVLTRLRYGAACDLRVQSRTAPESILPTPYAPPPGGRGSMIDSNGHWLDSALPLVRKRLHELSTEEGRQAGGPVAAREIHLHFPLPMLKAGLEIIDTPGTNVDIQSHRSVTKGAVESADACIFLMDARNAFKASEKQFLDEVRQSVGKCFFVVNKMDLLDPDEDDLDDVLAEWTATLKGVIGEGKGQLYLVSSLNADALPANARPYRARIDELRDDILAFMSQNRRRMIVQALLGRLRTASRDLGAEAVNQRRTCEQALAQLRSARLTDPAEVTNRIASLALDAVRPDQVRVAQSVSAVFDRHKQAVLQEFYERLVANQNADAVKANAGNESAQALSDLGRRLTDQLGKEYASIVGAAATQVVAQYAQLYEKLPFKASPRDGTPESIRRGLGALPVSPQQVSSQIQNRVSKPETARIAGAVAGAAVGAMLLGPIGVGLWRVGAAMFAKSKEDVARDARNELAGALDEAGGTLVPQLQGYFHGALSPIEAQLGQVVLREVNNFASVVQAAIDAHTEHERGVQRQIAEIEAVRQTLETSATKLERADAELRAALAATAIKQATAATALVLDSLEQVQTLCDQAVHLALAGSLSQALSHLVDVEGAVREAPGVGKATRSGLGAEALLRRARATSMVRSLNQARSSNPGQLPAMIASTGHLIEFIPEPWFTVLNDDPSPLSDTLWALALAGHPNALMCGRVGGRVPLAQPLAEVAAKHKGVSASPECQAELVRVLRALPAEERQDLLDTLSGIVNSGAAARIVPVADIEGALVMAGAEAARLDAADIERTRSEVVVAQAREAWKFAGIVALVASAVVAVLAFLSSSVALGLSLLIAVGLAVIMLLGQRQLPVLPTTRDPAWTHRHIVVAGPALGFLTVSALLVGTTWAWSLAHPTPEVPNASSTP